MLYLPALFSLLVKCCRKGAQEHLAKKNFIEGENKIISLPLIEFTSLWILLKSPTKADLIPRLIKMLFNR